MRRAKTYMNLEIVSPPLKHGYIEVAIIIFSPKRIGSLTVHSLKMLLLFRKKNLIQRKTDFSKKQEQRKRGEKEKSRKRKTKIKKTKNEV